MRKYMGYIIVLIFGLIPLIPLFYSGLPVTHDGQDHVARIANFYMSLTEGNIVPRWAGNLNWGYGHPVIMFLYPFPSYFASFFHFLGFSLVSSVKIVFGLSYILSGIGMYLWIKNLGGEKAGLAAAIVYMYAPYRFVDLYVRGAIGEHSAFLFAPFICYFLFKLSKNYSNLFFLGLSFSTSGLILSHNAIAIMLFPIIFCYFFTLANKKNKKFIITSLSSIAIGIGISSFFLIPAFFEGKYTLRDIVTGNFEYRTSFVKFFDFFNPLWNFGTSAFLSKQIGIPIIISFIISLFLLIKSKSKKSFLLLTFAVSIVFSVFLMMRISDFIWANISLIQKFQFPWRFLSAVVFSGSVLTGLVIWHIKNKKVSNTFFFIIISSAVIFSVPYIKVQSYINYPEEFFSGIYYGTTDTGESAPLWSIRFMEKEAELPAEIIEGEGIVSNYKKTSTKRSYTVKAKTSARVRENTLYFPNWEVYVNGNKTKIEYQDPANRGLITFYVPKGTSDVYIIFNDTKLRKFANVTSLIFLAILFIFIFFPKKKVYYDS